MEQRERDPQRRDMRDIEFTGAIAGLGLGAERAVALYRAAVGDPDHIARQQDEPFRRVGEAGQAVGHAGENVAVDMVDEDHQQGDPPQEIDPNVPRRLDR